MTYFYKQIEELDTILNLSNEEIIEYVDIFIREDGLTKNKAYIKLAKITGKSKTTIQRIYKDRDKPKEKESLLYIFYNTETKRTKIGISEDVYRRLIQLENASGCEIVCMFVGEFPYENTADIEKTLHDVFAPYRYKGEWFNIHYTDVVEVLKKSNVKDITDRYIYYKKPLCLRFKTWKQFLQYYS